jgi:hypothetical protein
MVFLLDSKGTCSTTKRFAVGSALMVFFSPDFMKSTFATTFPDSFPIFSQGDDPTSQAEFKGLPALY